MAASKRKREVRVTEPSKDTTVSNGEEASNQIKPPKLNASNAKDLKDVYTQMRLDTAPDEDGVDSTDSELQSETSEYSGLSEDDDDEESDDEESDNEQTESDGEFSGLQNLIDGTSGVSVEPAPKFNEYEYDSSDEEDTRNTVGNIPMSWYEDYPHIGYDLAGRKILKPQTGDELDNLIEQSENPDYWRTVKDPQTGQNIVLSREDCKLIQKLKSGSYADADVDPYNLEWVGSFEKDVELHPLSNRPEHKRSFIPSKWERLKVGKMVHAMKMGWMKTPSQINKEREEKAKEEVNVCYDLWSNEDLNDRSRLKMHIPAPKTVLPGHSESYNPPSEYLFSKEELKKWKQTDKEDRRQNFVPQKYSSMRAVPAYRRFINERFERCLDLYLCPRQQKMRMNVNPEDLIPKLPQPKDLQPFPSTEAIVYNGHKDIVTTISVDPSGQWMVSGSDDKTVKFWEVQTGRCMATHTFDEKVKCVAWSPNSSLSIAAVASGSSVFLLNPNLGDKLVITKTDEMFASGADGESQQHAVAKWTDYDLESEDFVDGYRRLHIDHTKVVGQVTWHTKGDYFAVTLKDAGNQSVIIHQISKRRSQCPFSKPKGLVQCTLFHPTKPFLFVATQRYIRVYNLLKQELARKLQANCKWISSMAIHPAGDNVITGSYDCRLHWFDMDLSTKPYQTLKQQKKAVRSVAFHKKYPLFASASDDGSVVVCHGMVYNDLMQNPLIVPVKILRGHGTVNGLSVIDCVFHPTQPWILTSGADSTIRLYS